MESEDVRKISRAVRIEEEAKRALEHGQIPKRPLSLHPSFRVEALVRTAPITARAPGAKFLELSRMKVVTSRDGNPLIPKESPSYLTGRIEAELSRLTPETRAQRSGGLLELLGSLQTAEPHGQAALALRRKVLAALFGERFLKSERDLPTERGPRAQGGAVRPGDEGKE